MLVQVAQQIIAALPHDIQSAQQRAVYEDFLKAFEAALWKADTIGNSLTVNLFSRTDTL